MLSVRSKRIIAHYGVALQADLVLPAPLCTPTCALQSRGNNHFPREYRFARQLVFRSKPPHHYPASPGKVTPKPSRGVGKTWLLRQMFGELNSCLWLDLLEEDSFLRFTRRPSELAELIAGKQPCPEWVIIDEVQRVPALLNEVHRIIENPKYHHQIKFALTGSSARKLRRESSNMLAGRALLNYLHPLAHTEMGADFALGG